MELSDEQSKLRRFILNDIENSERLEIEERLLADAEYLEEVLIAEESLIQDYADESLDEETREKFERHFLSSKENRQKVQFARALRKYVNENRISPEAEKKPRFFDLLKAFFSAPAPIALAVLLIAGIVVFFVWKNYAADSEVLVALNKAYEYEGPIELRISDLNYAPPRNRRGADPEKADKNQLEFAKITALKAVREKASAKNLHELGRVYLAEKNFQGAIEQLETAVKLAPDNAKLHNDLGAAYLALEKSRNERNFEAISKANEEFGKAIQLDNSLKEAFFNRASALQLTPMTEQAKKAWEEYLKLDSSSAWADEARKNLKILEEQKPQEVSAADLEKKFIEFFFQKNAEEAWQLMSQNRHLMGGKYIPQRLAVSYLEAADYKKKELYQVMIYAADLEKKFAGDPFAADLVKYYANLSPDKTELLKNAQASLQRGFEFRRQANLTDAAVEFRKAKELFLQAGNVWESKLSEHCLAFCFYYTMLRPNSLQIWQDIKDFSEKRNYKWLELTASRWLAGYIYYSERYSEAHAKYKQAYELAEAINDTFAQRELLNALIDTKLLVGQRQEAFALTQKLLTLPNFNESSPDQKWRIYQKVFDALISLKFYQTAKIFAFELVRLADEIKNDPSYTSYSSRCAAIAFLQTKDFSEARKWTMDRLQKADSITEPLLRSRHLSDNYLELANIERASGALEDSIVHYDEAIRFSADFELPLQLYQAHKGKLLSHLALNNQSEVDQQLPVVLELTEKYREKISEEQQRINFFEFAQDIYDIGTDFEFRRQNYEISYNYAEKSNSRSLLDWLKKGARISKDKNNLEILFKENAAPLELRELQARMPDRVQILQYSVLPEKVIIWVISKDKFIALASEIKSEELNQKVENYIKAILKHRPAETEQTMRLSREIFDLLIAPVAKELDPEKEICLIPQKFLFNLPFAALISAENKYFLEEFNFFYAPSANVFLISTEKAQEKAAIKDEALLSVGNPTFDRQKFPDLEDLVEAENEANAITAFYNTRRTLLKHEATKFAFLEQMREANVVHFAGHYLVTQGAPLSSSLVLAKNAESPEENILTNAELVGENLAKAKLVILSACQTGTESYYNGEGLFGLSRTFLAMGVPVVVASQWKVDSDAATELMKKFHFYRREGFSTPAALRKAQIDLLKTPGTNYEHPYYWAAFASFGGYAEF